jgi:GIY-YIG catalytic domain-containing protein
MRIKSFESEPNQIYRHFNAEGELLYVGISLSAIVRLAGHRNKSEWFDKIARVEIENLPNRSAALKAELLAIKTEKPKHNLSGKPEFRPKPQNPPKTSFTLDKVKPGEMYDANQTCSFLKLKSHEMTELICAGRLEFTPVPVTDHVAKFTGDQILKFARRNGRMP